MIKRITLDSKNWLFKEETSGDWQQAVVPGCIHLDLLNLGKIPDPFYGDNEKKFQWITDRNWDYRTRFDLKDKSVLQNDRIELVFDGIDTYSEITLNGRKLGQTQNMFHEYRFDIKGALKATDNVLSVNLKSPVKTAKYLEQKNGKLLSAFDSSCVYARKAQYSFGWDWGPRFPTSGIYKSLRIEAYDTARIVSIFVKVDKISAKEALLQIEYEIDSLSGTELNAGFDVLFEGISAANQHKPLNLRRGLNTGSFSVEIKGPRLWYPNGYGKQPLYDIVFSLRDKNKIIDTFKDSFGIRKVRVRQDKDSIGRTFIFEVNGIKIFAKGFNWIPADSFIPRIRDNKYRRLLHLAKESNSNMLRIWGGGIYENDIFYKLCDKLGIMIWQDFMFACGIYPEQKWFLDSVTREFNYQIRQLRNHPSIVLWCGNNENEGYKWAAWGGYPRGRKMSGEAIYYKILPALCKKLDPGRPYWPSSPWGYEKKYSSQESGDRHSWDVWNSADYTGYLNEKGRFISEFGFQSMPNFSTLLAFTQENDRFPASRVMELHEKYGSRGIPNLYRFMSGMFPVPEDLKEFAFISQIVQGYTLKFGIEHWRRRKFDTAGALIWQLNDCWPVISWSVVDYSLKPKASFYYVKKVFAPVLVSLEKNNDGVSIWIVNDKLKPVTGKLHIQLKSILDGKVSFEKKLNVSVGANTSKNIIYLGYEDFGLKVITTPTLRSFANANGKYVYAFIEVDGKRHSGTLLLNPLKHLDLGQNKIIKLIKKFSSIEAE